MPGPRSRRRVPENSDLKFSYKRFAPNYLGPGIRDLAPSRLLRSATALVASVVVATSTALAQATVDGVVYDSISRGVLVGATVQFYGPTDSAGARIRAATTDSRGAFRIAGLPRGRYLAGFFHPSLDSLGLEIPAQTIDVTSDRHAKLATPSPVGLQPSVLSRQTDERLDRDTHRPPARVWIRPTATQRARLRRLERSHRQQEEHLVG